MGLRWTPHHMDNITLLQLLPRGRYFAEKSQKCPDLSKFCPSQISQTFQHFQNKVILLTRNYEIFIILEENCQF